MYKRQINRGVNQGNLHNYGTAAIIEGDDIMLYNKGDTRDKGV